MLHESCRSMVLKYGLSPAIRDDEPAAPGYPIRLIPQKGDPVVRGSLVDLVISDV